MTINDREVNEQIVELHQKAGLLDYYMREGREMDLFRALSDIELAANRAMWRMNDIKYRNK